MLIEKKVSAGKCSCWPEIVCVVLVVQIPDLEGPVRATGGEDSTAARQLVGLNQSETRP